MCVCAWEMWKCVPITALWITATAKTTIATATRVLDYVHNLLQQLQHNNNNKHTQNAAHLSGLAAAATTTQVKQKTKTKLKIHKQFRSRLCQLQAPSASASLPLAHSLSHSLSCWCFTTLHAGLTAARTQLLRCALLLRAPPPCPRLYNALT